MNTFEVTEYERNLLDEKYPDPVEHEVYILEMKFTNFTEINMYQFRQGKWEVRGGYIKDVNQLEALDDAIAQMDELSWPYDR